MNHLEQQARQGIPGIAALFDQIVSSLRKPLTRERFELNSNLLVVIGHYTLIAIAVLILLFKATIAVKVLDRSLEHSFTVLAQGVGWILFIVVGHYVALKFLPRIQPLIGARSTELQSSAYLDSIVIINLALILGLVAVGLYHTYSNMRIGFLLTIVVLGFACFYSAWLALRPELVGTTVVDKAEPAQEALNVLSFLININYRAIPVFYGIGLLLSACNLLAACLFLWMGKYYAGGHYGAGMFMLVFYLLAPFGGYLVFIVLHLFIDLCRSILRRG